MIIKSLRMENYRPYKGPIYIDFSHSDKNITVIMGDNDLGKTTLLNAISWCLFDDEHYKKSDGKIYNKESGKNLKKNESLKVIVEVTMENNEGKTFKFKRFKKYVKQNKRIKPVSEKSTFTVYEITDSNDDEIPNPNSFRETILPKSLQEYFLFDGERLIEWFENDSDAVKKAIKRLSQLDLIDNVKKRTNLRIGDLEDELSTLNPQKAKFIADKEKLLDQKSKDENTIKENNDLINDYKNQINKNKEIISNLGEDPAKLLGEIEELERDVAKWESEKELLIENHRKFLIESIPYVLGSSLIEKNIIQREIEESDSDLNFSFDSKDISRILNRKKCICGHYIDENDSSYNILLELQSKLEENEINSQSIKKFNDLTKRVDKILDKYPDVGSKISEFAVHIGDIEETLLDKDKKLKSKRLNYDSLDEQYKEFNKTDIDKKIENLNKLIEGCNRKIWNAEQNLSKYPSKLTDINNKIRLEENKSEKEDEIHEKIAFCNEVIVTCDLLRDKVKKDIHDRLEEEVNREFESIYNGDGERVKYKSIIINDSFDIFFEELDGEVVPSTRPSSGTQLVAALSFITALNSCSGFKLPQIMDTSLGRWGDRLRRNFADALPIYSKNKQMIFLFLDSEYNLEFRDKIDDYVGEKYKLKFVSPDVTDIEKWEDKYE